MTTTPPRDLYAEFITGWDQMEIHAHDIHSTCDGTIYATEALLRWRRSPGELWAAAMALPIAEETGLITQCTQWALELSIATWAGSANRAHGGHLSLNLHRTQLEQPDLVSDLRALCAEHDVLPAELVFEIPDRLGHDGCRLAAQKLDELVDAGARLALDDHRGSASKTKPDPSWLPPGSLVKLDSAITGVCDHQIGRDIMELTADELHANGYEVVAEAIERPAQLAAVIQCHIGWAQGYLFAKPSPLV
ncbi:MAG: EAL domain-containing protein [Actinomycetota bacterium]